MVLVSDFYYLYLSISGNIFSSVLLSRLIVDFLKR